MTSTTVENPHGQKNFDPQQYRTTGMLWPSDSEVGRDMWLAMDRNEVADLEAARHEIEERGHVFHRCTHCGNYLRWVHIVQHVPTGDLLSWGSICIERLGIPTRDDFRELLSERGRKSWAERGARIRRLHEFAAAQPWLAVFIALGSGDFYRNLRDGIRQYGDLTERQHEAVVNAMGEAHAGTGRYGKREPKPEPEVPLQIGRRVVEGRVLSVKWQESDFGGAYKMLVEQDDLNRVWGTVPSALSMWELRIKLGVPDSGASTEDLLVGRRVRFTAAVERSRKDDHFGFYKRPTKAELVQEVSA